jgi:ABC-2 type transport system ATP-binding protein
MACSRSSHFRSRSAPSAARILLLDEPYQGFDHGAYVSFWEHVARWRGEGIGVVVVTHLLADQALVDRVVELELACHAAGDEQ